MSIITRYSYRLEKPILYNNLNTQRLYGALISPNKVSKIGGYRRIPEGSFLAAGQRLLPRGRLISPYTSGGTTIVVANPYVFVPGDILKLIGTSSSTPLQEATAVSGGSAAAFGTVVSVDSGTNIQVTTITPSSVAVGNIFTLLIDETPFTFTAVTTSAADVVTGLIAAFNSTKSNVSTWEGIRLTAISSGNVIQATSLYPSEIFVTKTSVAQGMGSTTGTLSVQVTTAIGALAIAPASSNATLDIGAKVGTITDLPLGVLSHEFYMTDYEGTDRDVAIAAYDQAMINTKALPYLDGSIVQQLNRLAFMPPYGSY